MTQKRKQLTLFIAYAQAKSIEEVRLKFNSLQYELIETHITLCREDEIENLEKVLANLLELKQKPIEINFGKVKRFSEGKGVLIPESGTSVQFQNLRKFILKGLVANPRIHKAHITLMHPRNSRCTDKIFREIELIQFATKITFSKISLIEQEIDKKWKVLKEFDLK